MKNKQKQKTKPGKEEQKQQQEGIELLNKGAIPIVKYDEFLNCGIMEDGSLIDFLKIETKDIYACDREKILIEQLLWDRLLKTYAGDLKEVSFLFPTDTQKQQDYIDYVARRTKNPMFREILSIEKEKLMEMQRDYFDREFVLCFFAKDKTELNDNRLAIKATLTRTNPPLVTELSAEKKKAVIYKLYNKNMNL